MVQRRPAVLRHDDNRQDGCGEQFGVAEVIDGLKVESVRSR